MVPSEAFGHETYLTLTMRSDIVADCAGYVHILRNCTDLRIIAKFTHLLVEHLGRQFNNGPSALTSRNVTWSC